MEKFVFDRCIRFVKGVTLPFMYNRQDNVPVDIEHSTDIYLNKCYIQLTAILDGIQRYTITLDLS